MVRWLLAYYEDYEDNKETNLRLFKLKLAHILNDVDDNLFEEIFGVTSVKLADKLINTTSKEDNQMLVNDIEINRDKIFERDKFSKYVIQPAHKRSDLLDAVKVILEFNHIWLKSKMFHKNVRWITCYVLLIVKMLIQEFGEDTYSKSIK